MVRAAEYSGSLEKVLLQIAIYLQRQDSAIKKLRSAMIYPAIILTLAFVVCGVLIVVVLPNFVALFNEFHSDLPLPTKVLLALGTFSEQYRVEIVAVTLVVVFAGFLFLQSKLGHVFWDHLIIRLPVLVTGDGFSEPLAATGLFMPMVLRMVRVGEETGTLDQSLDQIADFLAEEMDYKVRNMIALMEPSLIIAVGAAVGFVAVSVILPMYGLLKAVH
jgi:type IV pilus assembly protein PilC